MEKRPEDVDLDRFSNLPESLKFEILLNLPTKHVVKTSVLSSRWRNLWRYVPSLDLGDDDFPDHDSFMSFVDSFMGFDGESCLQNFKLEDWYDGLSASDQARFSQWIGNAIRRKVRYLHFLESLWPGKKMEMPLTVYTCESLVSLKLCEVVLVNPKSVSLPCLKVMLLDRVEFANDRSFQMLVSGCPILESLTVKRRLDDNVQTLRVCSQSLLSFTHVEHRGQGFPEGLVVVIDAPRLEKLELDGCATDSFVIDNVGSLDKVVLDVMFNYQFDTNDLPKRNMIRSFLHGISSVKDMVITAYTLVAIDDYLKREALPLFRNLSSLSAEISSKWEIFSIFLKTCPNLKCLSLKLKRRRKEPIRILPLPHSFLQTIEFVEIQGWPMGDDVGEEMKLARYFLENSTILKEFTLWLSCIRKSEGNVILKKFLFVR